MINKKILENKIQEAEWRLKLAQRDFNYWEKCEQELKLQYGENALHYQRKHIHNIKNYKKNAKSEILFHQKELNDLKQKYNTILVFG